MTITSYVQRTVAIIHVPSPADVAAAVIATLLAWQGRARQRKHLREIDDRLLKDVGMSRTIAETEGRKPVWRA